MHYHGITILFLWVSAGSLTAQTGNHNQSAASPVVARSGKYQLTEQMIGQAVRFGQFLAGADFSAADTTALRRDLIDIFQKEPGKQSEAYESVAKALREAPGLRPNPSMLAVALDRYKAWQWYGENQQAFRDFQSYPFGRMVLKYNPVLVNSGGMIVTRADVECQFYADAVVAQAAGVPAPAQSEKDQFVRNLPSQFASMPREQQEHLRQAELRLASFRLVYDGTVTTKAAIVADIQKNVHSSGDVRREARQVEEDAQYGAKYDRLYHSEAVTSVFNAGRVNQQIQGLGRAGRSATKTGDINVPIGR
jgi:hypothetical protein